MRRSVASCVRGKGLFSMFGKSSAEKSVETQLTKEQQEKLRSMLPSLRTDAERSNVSVQGKVTEFDADDVIDQRVDMDSIRARGLLKYRYKYTPPKAVESMVLNEVKRIIPDGDETTSLEENNEYKAQVLLALGKKLKHLPLNGNLHNLKTVQDVIDFYATPVNNITSYASLARDETKPRNVHVMEHPVRFHPEDTEAYHGGVTAFPGTGGEVLSIRNKRLYRQFKAKEDWFEYDDQTFDFTRPDKDMPWDPEVAKRMDRYPDKRYNLSTKQFTRAK